MRAGDAVVPLLALVEQRAGVEGRPDRGRCLAVEHSEVLHELGEVGLVETVFLLRIGVGLGLQERAKRSLSDVDVTGHCGSLGWARPPETDGRARHDLSDLRRNIGRAS